jgi:DnaJ-domain-containing protein 1
LLHRERATGVLELVEWSGATAGRSHRVHLSEGLVGSVDSALPVARLGEILEAAGFIEAKAERLLAQRLAALPHKRAGEILVEAHLASQMAVTAALRHQLRRKLDALFALTDARVKFHVAQPIRDDRLGVPLSPREFLHGRPRKRDTPAPATESHRGVPRSGRPWPPPGYQTRSSQAGGCRLAPTRARALQVLGLESSADQDAVRRAFRRLAAQVHPDRHPRASAGEVASLMKRFAELSAAYHQLVA